MKIMKGGGRQIKTLRPQTQVITRKPVGSCVALVREKVFHYWYNLDRNTRQIAKDTGIPREVVEADVRRGVRERLNPNPPADVVEFPLKRAA